MGHYRSLGLLLVSIASTMALASVQCDAQSANVPQKSVSKEPGSWGRAQIDAGGRYSILWAGKIEERTGNPPNPKVVFLVEATDNVNQDRGVVFRGRLMVACGSRVVTWKSIDIMKLQYLDEILERTGNATEFTPSTSLGYSAWEAACGEDAKNVLAFEQAIEAAVTGSTMKPRQ